MWRRRETPEDWYARQLREDWTGEGADSFVAGLWLFAFGVSAVVIAAWEALAALGLVKRITEVCF